MKPDVSSSSIVHDSPVITQTSCKWRDPAHCKHMDEKKKKKKKLPEELLHPDSLFSCILLPLTNVEIHVYEK